jgi:AcrR family transcriptional regulator
LFKSKEDGIMAHFGTEAADPTAERLLKEAEALFAKKGYEGVSVREITSKARCNLAAVNYHFGNKKNLYVEVFRCRWVPRAQRLQQYFNTELPPEPSLHDLVETLARAFLAGPMPDEDRCCHLQLMSRELGQPTEAFDLVADTVMRPFFEDLAQRFAPSLGGNQEKESLVLNLLSVFAMVLYFNFAREAVSRITGRSYDEAFKTRLVKQITAFSLQGLRGGRS